MSYQKVCLYFAFDFISIMMVTKPVMIFFHFPPPPVLDVEYFITPEASNLSVDLNRLLTYRTVYHASVWP